MLSFQWPHYSCRKKLIGKSYPKSGTYRDQTQRATDAWCNLFRNEAARWLRWTDSWTVFQQFGVDPIFLRRRAAVRDQADSFNQLKTMIWEGKVVNDAAERALGLITEYNTSAAPRNEEQALWQMIKHMRDIVGKATGATTTGEGLQRVTCSGLIMGIFTA